MQKRNSLESGIDILGVVFVRLKKNMQHILRQYHFSFPINQGIKRINAGEKKLMGLLQLLPVKFQDTEFSMKLHLEVS